MGIITESAIKAQAKKGQGETNERLDAIRAALEEQNRLLQQILAALTVRQ